MWHDGLRLSRILVFLERKFVAVSRRRAWFEHLTAPDAVKYSEASVARRRTAGRGEHHPEGRERMRSEAGRAFRQDSRRRTEAVLTWPVDV